jgi:hypothetical protein
MKKDELHEQHTAKKILAVNGLAEALYALGRSVLLQDRGDLASRGPQFAAETGQDDSCPPPQERGIGLGLQVLLNRAF